MIKERSTALKLNFFDRIVALAAVMFLGMIALRPLFAPEAAMAQSHSQAAFPEAAPVYIEPGVRTIIVPDRSSQVLGKVVVDLTNGNVWGFPTLADVPYPTNAEPGKTTPPISRPVYLGRYDFSAMTRSR
jgi:hypothetical protein